MTPTSARCHFVSRWENVESPRDFPDKRLSERENHDTFTVRRDLLIAELAFAALESHSHEGSGQEYERQNLLESIPDTADEARVFITEL